MDRPRLATWKYTYGGPLDHRERSARRLIVAAAAVAAVALLALLALLAGLPGGALLIAVAVVLLVVALVRAAIRPTKIGMSSRYLVCGGEIMYFANVVSVDVDLRGGVLRLVSGNGNTFELVRAGFTTDARKPPKIEANLHAKFARVSDRIVARVRQASPDAQIRELGTEGR